MSVLDEIYVAEVAKKSKKQFLVDLGLNPIFYYVDDTTGKIKETHRVLDSNAINNWRKPNGNRVNPKIDSEEI